jgi:hypothetical protein
VLLEQIQWVHPRIHGALLTQGMIPEVLFMPWFLPLYLNVLPAQTALRVWDLLFCQPKDASDPIASTTAAVSAVLVRVGLAIIALLSDAL